MTAQIDDGFTYGGESYAVAGINGRGLFDPGEHGIRCTMMHTACWRGYIADYAIEGGELRLASLEVQFADAAEAQRGVPILGSPPKEVSEYGRATYAPNARVAFTGGLLLAKDFISELYVHMGFHPPWKYRVVHELAFENGRLVREADRSAAMADIRARLAARPLSPSGADYAELRSWIEQCFDRSYV